MSQTEIQHNTSSQKETDTLFFELIQKGKPFADRLFADGIEPDIKSLAGYEFDGCNLFSVSKLLGIRKFRKGMWQTQHGQIMGYNIPIARNKDHAPWIPKPSAESPKHFGFYLVSNVQSYDVESLHENAILLDYSKGKNGFFEFSWVLRDYLRQPYPENDNILIGAAYLALGKARVFSNYFALRKSGPSTYKGARIELESGV